jgi:hypothetical protein
MSTNEVYGPGNAPVPPANTTNGQVDARPGVLAKDFTMPDAPVGVQQAWYTHAAGQALMYAQSGAASTPDEHETGVGTEAQAGGAYAPQHGQRPPFIRTTDTECQDAAPSMGPAQDPVEDPAGRPYTLPALSSADMDMPLAIGSHPYAARLGSMHRRRIGVYHQPDPSDTGVQAGDGSKFATAATGCPYTYQSAPAWEEKQTVCFYCKTENWPRRTFCYMCRRDFATGWWHPDGCECGDC